MAARRENSLKIAVIAGDGIGKEVVPQGLRVLRAAADRFGLDIIYDEFPFSSWDYYEQHGRMLPIDWKDQIGSHDAIYFGAVGAPDVPDHVTLWGLRLPICQGFDQYANVRPTRIIPGVKRPATQNPIVAAGFMCAPEMSPIL